MYKSRAKDDVPEVNFYRSKLDGVLQTLVEQNDDGLGSQEKEGSSRLDTETEMDDYSSSATPSKKNPRVGGVVKSNRKRKMGKEEATNIEYGQFHHSYTVKLFERTVDLAQFTEKSPLYPLCRAWIRNDPYQSFLNPQSTSMSSDELENENESEDKDGSLGYVYELPKPCIIKQEVDGGVYVDLRIPSPLPSTDEPLDIHADESMLPDAELLLVNHMQRWRQVRQKWRNAAHLNELQYADSLNIIKELYDRQNSIK